MFYLSLSRVFFVAVTLLFSTFAQAIEFERVVFRVENVSGRSQSKDWSFLVGKKDSELVQSRIANDFGFFFEWDKKKNILKVMSRGRFEKVQAHSDSIPIKIVTHIPVQLEGKSGHPVILVSPGGEIVGRWSSPSLTFSPSENLPSEAHLYQIRSTGAIEVQALTQSSGKFLNEGKILSSNSLDVEVLSGKFDNLGVIESRSRLRFKGSVGNKNPHFLNMGKVIAPEIEVGSLFERFYSFQNGNEKKGLINTKKLFADIDYFINSAEIQVSEQVSIAGFNLDNQKGKFHSGGSLRLDFAEVNNRKGSLSGNLKTELKIRASLNNQKGEMGAVSLTELTFYEGVQVNRLGKVQGTEILLSANQSKPVTLKDGELQGQKSISISSKSAIRLPQVQVHTPMLNLSVPDFALDEQKACSQTFIHCDPARNFSLTSPYCTDGSIVFLQSCLSQAPALTAHYSSHVAPYWVAIRYPCSS